MPTSSALRSFAEDPAAWGEIRPETGLRRILTDRYCLLLGPVPSFTLVSRLRLDPDEVAETIAEVRAAVAAHGHRRAEWRIGSSATPADLIDSLVSHGFQSKDHYTSLVLTREPPRVDGVVARRIRDLDEFAIATAIAHDVFGTPEEERREWAGLLESRFEAERAGHGPRTYLAFADGHAVGTAAAIVEGGQPAALLVGGSVVPAARGRGAYRALVRARWDDAVAAGMPALTVDAGSMSRPILERLGFAPVAHQDALLDPATC